MLPLIVCSLAVILLWTFASQRLLRGHITGPVVMVVGGVVAGLVLGGDFGTHLNTDLAERLVELILAVLLFVDATEVRGGFLAGERGVVARLLIIALPLSLAVAFVLGLPLLGASSWAVVLAIACVVMPIDFAPAAELLRDHRLPRRVRHVLAVESGYNDGIFSPVFAFALIVVDLSAGAAGPVSALEHAVPAAAFAVLAGVGIGTLTGLALRWAVRARWTDLPAVGSAMILVPLLTYAIAVSVGGNGFVAAFLAGIAYKLGRMGRGGAHGEISHAELSAVDSVGMIASMIMWFVFGAVAVLVFEIGIEGAWILYGLLVLTAARVIPVFLSMLGSGLRRRDRALLGLIGPRGTSSIVFGLLAYNALRDDDADIALYVMTVVVIGSMLLHGVAVSFGTRRYAAGAAAHTD